MTDKSADHTDHDFTLNHFDPASNVESEQAIPNPANDLFSEAEQKMESPFDGSGDASPFAENGFEKQEPSIPEHLVDDANQPDLPEQSMAETMPAVDNEHPAIPTNPDADTSHDPFAFDDEADHADTGSTPFTPEQSPATPTHTAEHISTPPPESQSAGIKPITVFAILAMLVAGLAIWLNPGENEHESGEHQNASPIMGQNIQIERLESRIANLEQRLNEQAGQQPNHRDNQSIMDVKRQLAELEQQVSALTGLVAKLARNQPAHPVASPRSVPHRAAPQHAVKQTTSVARKAPTGWVINLVSVDSLKGAQKALARYQAKGITAEIFPTQIKGKQWYRLRIAGFASKQAANEQRKILTRTFGINDTWVQKP